MVSYRVKITGVEQKNESITLDYDLMKDGVVFKHEVINIQGDNIDIAVLKAKVILELNRMKGVDVKANQLISLLNNTYELNIDGTDIVKV